jgi:hypothetical protein
MRKPRDIIQEIEDIRSRRQFESTMSELPSRLRAIQSAFDDRNNAHPEFVRYFPVALVACIERYFRMVVQDLIDSGNPYLGRAETLGLKLKPDIRILCAIQEKKVTVGEWVAHGVSISSLEHIESALTNLIGSSFLEKLRSTKNRWAHEVRGEPERPILDDPDNLLRKVERTFTLRNIICHETASGFAIDSAEIESCFESCVLFLQAADECVSELLHPGAPLNQAAMNRLASNQLHEAEKRLRVEIDRLTETFGNEWRQRFDSVQAEWQSHCKSWTDFQVGERQDSGSMWPMLYWSARQQLIEQWTAELERYRLSGGYGA